MVAFFQQVGSRVLGTGPTGLIADSVGQDFTAIPDRYDEFEAHYRGDPYSAMNRLAHAVGPQLPVDIRAVHSPTKRTVDWWPAHVYPGVWSDDGLPVQGKANRIPYASDTPEALRRAVQQVFSWGNWGSELRVYVLTGAMIGDVFVEMEANVERGKVYPRLVHPRYVKDIAWNSTGDVTMYRLEIPMQDAKGIAYRWGKVVTKDEITTLRDDAPHPYEEGEPATRPNPWGFVPGIWVQHRNVGGQHGSPAIDGVIGKINELNGVVSAINTFILKFIDQYVIVGSDNPAEMNDAIAGIVRRKPTDPVPTAFDTVREAHRTEKRSRIPILGAKGSVSAIRLYENMGLADAVPHRDRLMEEIENDLSEMTLTKQLLDMTQVTEPGALPLVQDVQHKLDESAGNYDAGVLKMGQMGVSMAAECIERGVWPRGSLTEAQKLFLPFSSQSYDRGELRFAISPRELVPTTSAQRIERAKQLAALPSVMALVESGEMDEAKARLWIAAQDEVADKIGERTSRTFNAGQLGGF